ncbi:hypothetical protein DFH09DRAFT_1160274 [Mycena vulgaris]|nr:hypothetical protein DFH09DRAFT_1160274 [Mycena vulgaris]
MLANDTITPRPRPPAQMRRSSARSLALGASPPPPYALAAAFLSENGRKSSLPNYLGSPLPATLQMVGLNSEPPSPQRDEQAEWLNEKSREELAELLLKADDLIKERETELGVTSAVCKSLHESNVTLKSKHDALVARIPPNPRHPPDSHVSFLDDASFDSTSSPRVYLKRHSRRISLLLKLENLEAEAQSADNSGRRALRQLEKEIQLLRDELDKTRAQSEQLEKKVQVGTEQIVEELWKKKKEREAKFRAMRNNNTPRDDAEIRDFAPPGLFSKASISPSPSTEFEDASYGSDPAFEHPNQHALVSQLLSKIQELEETNAQIIRQQSETTDKLQAVQRETESISKVYECFGAEDGVEWEVVGENGHMDGTIRFKSFRRTLDAEDDNKFSTLVMPRKARKSVLNLFDAANEPGPSKLVIPSHNTLSSTTELSPLKFDTSQSQSSEYAISPFLGSRQTLQAELGDDFIGGEVDPFLQRSSLYDFPLSSPTPGSRSLKGRVSDARASRDQTTPTNNALQLSVEPPSPSGADAGETGSLRERNKDRYRRMSETMSLRTGRWADGRFPGGFPGATSSPLSRRIDPEARRLSSALDVVIENFTAPIRANDDADADASPSSSPIDAVVVDDGGQKKKQAFVAFVLEVWLWLQFGIIIVVFLWAMAKRGPKSVLSEADRRAVVKRR